jgi:malate synthase
MGKVNTKERTDTSLKISGEAPDTSIQNLLNKELTDLLVELHEKLDPERQSLLWSRKVKQSKFNEGEAPEYLNKNNAAVEGDWNINPLPEDLKKRRVEITGPVNSAKMVINMLSRNKSGDRADMAMLDFEDSMKPSWPNIVDGYNNVIGAVRGDLRFKQPAKGDRPAKTYSLDPDDMPGVMVRVRGLHLNEPNITINGEPLSAGLLDLAVTFYHTAALQVQKGRTPKYYIPNVNHTKKRAGGTACLRCLKIGWTLKPAPCAPPF